MGKAPVLSQANGVHDAGEGHDLIHARMALESGRELGFDEDRDPAVGPMGFQALINRPGQDDVTEAGKPYNEDFGRQRRLYHFARRGVLLRLGFEFCDTALVLYQHVALKAAPTFE